MIKSLFSICVINILICNSIQQSVEESEYHELKDIKALKSVRNAVNYGINGTGVQFDTSYYLVDSNGAYLRWDGRKTSENFRYGLTANSYNNNINNDWYLFTVEPNGNAVSIKNIATGRYISNDYPSYFFLMNESNSSGYPHNSQLIDVGNNLISIRSALSGYPYYLSAINVNVSINNISIVTGLRAYASSASAAQLNFIPAPRYRAKITSFNYEDFNESALANQTAKVNLISPTYIDNDSPLKFTHEIIQIQSVNETFTWTFYNINGDFELEIIGNPLPIWLFGEVEFENGASRRNANFKTTDRLITIQNEHKYLVKKSIEITPNVSVKIESVCNFVSNFEIDFTAVAEVTAELGPELLTGEKIGKFLNDYHKFNFDIEDYFTNSVKINISGKLTGSFCLSNKFKVTKLN